MTSKFKFVIALCAVVAVQFCLRAKMIDATPIGRIPFTLGADSRIYVTAFVNGSDSLRFLVDTGATSVVLNTNSPKLAGGYIHSGVETENLGTSGVNTIRYSNDNSVKIGSIQYDDAGCAHIPYPPEYWDGVMGLNALAAFNVEINYDEFMIYCYPKTEFPIDSCEGVVMPFIYKYGVPFAEFVCALNGERHNILLEIDTGSDRSIDLSTAFVNRHDLLETQKPFSISYISSSDGSSGELKDVYIDEVIAGNYVFTNVEGAFSTLTSGMLGREDIDGMAGNRFLKRFNMFIDFAGNKLYLQPNNNCGGVNQCR